MRKFGVVALTQEIDKLLAKSFPVVLVEGEVTQVQTPASGHAYFTLREADTILPCVVWKADWARATWRPKQGDKALVRGRLGVYPGQGRYQLYVNVLRPAGEGELQRELEERKARLEADGLLDPRRKRPLPAWPKFVGVATSLTGAALQDFLRVSRERYPAARILLAGCTVQGAEAPASVIRALELLYQDGRSDVVVVTRGGGSQADLMAFNDEQLARFIASSPIPVVSAVGHEIDTSIADLVADAAAPTPTAAAVLVLPDGRAIAQRVDELAFTLEAAARRELVRRRRAVEGLTARLRHPGERLAAARARRAELEARLHAVMARHLQVRRDRLTRASAALTPAGRRVLRERRHQLELWRRSLTALSPYAVLERGYAIVTGPSGVISDAGDVAVADGLRIRLRRGALRVTVDAVESPDPTPDAG